MIPATHLVMCKQSTGSARRTNANATRAPLDDKVLALSTVLGMRPKKNVEVRREKLRSAHAVFSLSTAPQETRLSTSRNH